MQGAADPEHFKKSFLMPQPSR